jgi:hypothetical protein
MLSKLKSFLNGIFDSLVEAMEQRAEYHRKNSRFME